MVKKLILTNEISEISRLEGFIEELSEDLSLDMALSFNLNLALEEAVTNVINYAFPTNEKHSFQVTASGEPGISITFVIDDDGVAFDPLNEAPDVDTSLSAEERPIGGLGIFLVRQIMSEVSYARTDGHNILTMTKMLNSTEA